MNKPNHICPICGKKYYHCDSCKKLETFQSWRRYGHDVNCFKIFIILKDDALKRVAREESKCALLKCDLCNLSNFHPMIKTHIKEILNS